MITALYTPTDELVSIDSSFPKEWLQSKSQSHEFKCRSCSHLVYTRLGDLKVWHFAHEKGSPGDCPLKWSTPSEDRIKLALLDTLNQKELKHLELEYFPKAFKSKWPIDILIQGPNDKWYSYQVITRNSKKDKIRETLPAKDRSILNCIFSIDYHRPAYNEWIRIAPKVSNAIRYLDSNHICFLDPDRNEIVTYQNLQSHHTNTTWITGRKSVIPIERLQIHPGTGLFIASKTK